MTTEAILPRPDECSDWLLFYFVLLGPKDYSGCNAGFAEMREQLNQKVEKPLQNAPLLSQLAVVDALLNKKETAILKPRGQSKCCLPRRTRWKALVWS